MEGKTDRHMGALVGALRSASSSVSPTTQTVFPERDEDRIVARMRLRRLKRGAEYTAFRRSAATDATN
jgi:hypothetical protein